MTITFIGAIVFAIWFSMSAGSVSIFLIGLGFAAFVGIDMYFYGKGRK